MDDFGTPDDEIDTQPASAAEPGQDIPPADPRGLGSLAFADLPRRLGDGVLSGVMRQMAANGHPGLQEWAATDAERNGAYPDAALSANALTSSPTAVATIRTFEAPGGKPLGNYSSLEGGTDTIGLGHKKSPGEDTSKFDPEAAYKADIAKAEQRVRAAVTVPLQQHQFDALVSFGMNEPGAFRASAPQKPNAFLDRLNEGNFAAAANQMLTHNTYFDKNKNLRVASGGLQRRRFHEADMFSNGAYRPFK
jgi:GH24 family phage-related lysozyme (muramidase)